MRFLLCRVRLFIHSPSFVAFAFLISKRQAHLVSIGDGRQGGGGEEEGAGPPRNTNTNAYALADCCKRATVGGPGIRGGRAATWRNEGRVSTGRPARLIVNAHAWPHPGGRSTHPRLAAAVFGYLMRPQRLRCRTMRPGRDVGAPFGLAARPLAPVPSLSLFS